jgi:hypothetical protein
MIMNSRKYPLGRGILEKKIMESVGNKATDKTG